MLSTLFNKQNRKRMFWGAVLVSNLGNVLHVYNYLNDNPANDVEIASFTTFAEEGHLSGISDITYDRDSNDSLNAIINDIADNVAAEMTEFVRYSMPDASEWNSLDRQRYERRLFQTVERTLSAHPVLGSEAYRSESLQTDITRESNLNALSHDLNGNTMQIEYDCESQSLVTGLIASFAEEKTFMGMGASDHASDYYGAIDYQYVVGSLNGLRSDYVEGALAGHAYIISPSTGAVIEATGKDYNTVYQPHISPEYGYQDFLDGQPVVTLDGDVYASAPVYPNELPQIRYDAAMAAGQSALAYTQAINTAMTVMDNDAHIQHLLAQTNTYNQLKEHAFSSSAALENLPDFEPLMMESHDAFSSQYTITINGEELGLADAMAVSKKAALNFTYNINADDTPSAPGKRKAMTLSQDLTAEITALEEHDSGQLIGSYYDDAPLVDGTMSYHTIPLYTHDPYVFDQLNNVTKSLTASGPQAMASPAISTQNL